MALSKIERGDRPWHRQLAFEQRAQQAELGVAADTISAAPEVAIAADMHGPAAAQVMAQDGAAEWSVDEPRRAAPARRDRLGMAAPVVRVEPCRIRLPQARAVEQNRAISRAFPERRHTFVGIEGSHPIESSKPRAQPVLAAEYAPAGFDLPATPVRTWRRGPRRAVGAHLAARLARYGTDLGDRQGRAQVAGRP